jgi:hypothetical protein
MHRHVTTTPTTRLQTRQRRAIEPEGTHGDGEAGGSASLRLPPLQCGSILAARTASWRLAFPPSAAFGPLSRRPESAAS